MLNNKKKLSIKAKIGISLAGIVAFFIILVAISSAATKGQPFLDNIKKLTNQKTISVSGYHIEGNAKAKIFINENEIKEVEADFNGRFVFNGIDLNEGENRIYVSTTNQGGQIKKSLVKKIILDTQKPNIELEQTEMTSDKDKVDIKGKSEKNTRIEIFNSDNSKIKEINKSNGDFSILVTLKEGENIFYVIATDEAGNQSDKGNIKITYNIPNKETDKEIQEQGNEKVTVSSITDGDTVKIKNSSGNEYKLRLIGIDAPETGKLYSQEATNKLSELILNREVELEKDVSETDKYERLLRYIWLNGTLINEEMVKQGYASSYTYPPDVKYQERITKAEQIARESKIGLWKEEIISQPNNSSINPTSPVASTPTSGTGSNSEATPQTQPAPTPSTPASSCYCSTNKYNCSDFSTHKEAQDLFDCCAQKVGGDVHKLDADKDGSACETLP